MKINSLTIRGVLITVAALLRGPRGVAHLHRNHRCSKTAYIYTHAHGADGRRRGGITAENLAVSRTTAAITMFAGSRRGGSEDREAS
jgi:hypothetical protein